MWGFPMCNNCGLTNHRGEGGTCNCVNPMSDLWGHLTAIAFLREDEAQRRPAEVAREQNFQRNLWMLFPAKVERAEFLEKSRPELGELSINQMAAKMPFGKEVAYTIASYLAGSRKDKGYWDSYFAHAVNGYFFPDEKEEWLNSPSELFGGKTNRQVAEDGGREVLTKILWFLLYLNPQGKSTPLRAEPRPMSKIEEEMLLDECFPESIGQAQLSQQAAYDARQNLKHLAILVAVIGIVLLLALLR